MVDVPADLTTTATLALNSVVGGEVEVLNDRDWYRMTLDAGVTYAVRLLGAGSGDNTLPNARLSILNDTGTLVASSFRFAASDVIFFTPSATGTYFADAGALLNFGASIGTYDVSLAIAKPIYDDISGGDYDTIAAALAGRTVSYSTIVVGNGYAGPAETVDVTQSLYIRLAEGIPAPTFNVQANPGTFNYLRMIGEGDANANVIGSDGASVYGTEGVNHILGGGGGDYFSGQGGADELRGVGGDDSLHGGDGDDLIEGGDGNDELEGGAGTDTISGGDGDDDIRGGYLYYYDFSADGRDVLNGDAGDDTIDGGFGDDVVDGGTGSDILAGGEGADAITGGVGSDAMSGGSGNDDIDGGDDADIIDGGDGDDTILGGLGNDVIAGGAGFDTIEGGDGDDFISGGDDGDHMLGGAGFDVVSWRGATIGAYIDLNPPSPPTGDALPVLGAFAAFGDAFAAFEGYFLTDHNDQFIGADETVIVYGFDGDDILIGSSQSDIFVGGKGADYFGGDDASLDGAWYHDAGGGVVINMLAPGQNAGDALGDYFHSIEGFVLTAFADAFQGGDGMNFVVGGAGADQMFGSVLSNDWFSGGDGNDFLAGGTWDDRLEGGAGDDLFAFADLATGGVDTIVDFHSNSDKIQLSGPNFGGLAGDHIFVAGVDFIVGSTQTSLDATTAAPTLLYDFITGGLFFDADGTGAGAAQLFATLDGAPGLAVSDIRVVDLA